MNSKRIFVSVLVSILLFTSFFIENTLAAIEPVVTMEQVEKAIKWAYSQSPNDKTYNGYCLRFVSDAFGKANLPPPNRTKPYSCATEAADDLLRFTDKNPPRGAVVFYNYWDWDDGVWKNLGHVAISLGDGKVIHYMNNKVMVTKVDIGGNVGYRGWGYWRDYEIKYLPDVKIQPLGQITAGAFHTVSLKEDGSVWTWGRFTSQRNDKNPNNDVPTRQLGIEDVVYVSAGFYYTAALKKDGTVWGWGNNDYGQLGNQTKTDSVFPVKAVGLDKVVKIDVGENHTVALKEDGTVWSWGFNNFGQLGDGTTSDRSIPTQVKGLDNVVSIVASNNRTIAIKKDGTVWGCGLHYGETAARIPELEGYSSISLGTEHGIAIKSDGSVWAWGWNAHGEHGNGTAENVITSELTRVKGLERIVAVESGNGHSVALKEDGTIWIWGINYDNTNNITIPVRVEGLNDVVSIATGLYRSHHIVAVKKDGTVWTIGWNDSGQLGHGEQVNSSNIPVQAIINLKGKVIKKDNPANMSLVYQEIKMDNKEYAILGYLNEKRYSKINKDLYFKLEDLAIILKDTERQFDIVKDNEKGIINIITDKPYNNGNEMTGGREESINSLVLNISMIYKDNVDMQLISYTINGNQYVRLEDIVEILNMGITGDTTGGKIYLYTMIY